MQPKPATPSITSHQKTAGTHPQSGTHTKGGTNKGTNRKTNTTIGTVIPAVATTAVATTAVGLIVPEEEEEVQTEGTVTAPTVTSLLPNLGISLIQAVPAGKARIYKSCTRHIPYVGNYTNQYVDLSPGTYNQVSLQLSGLTDLVYGVLAGSGVQVQIYKQSDMSDTPLVISTGSNANLCLPELWKGRARGIKIIATEGFDGICGFDLLQMLLIFLVLFALYCFYSRFM
jgi:hypothetical protein